MEWFGLVLDYEFDVVLFGGCMGTFDQVVNLLVGYGLEIDGANVFGWCDVNCSGVVVDFDVLIDCWWVEFFVLLFG